MHIAKTFLLAATALASVVAATAPAMALPTIPSNSSFQIGGSLSAYTSSTFVNASGFDFGQLNSDGTFTYGTAGGYAELGGTGSAFYRDLGGTNQGFVAGTAGTATDIAAGTFNGIGTDGTTSKVVNINNLYSFSKNGLTLSFDLGTITDVQRYVSIETSNQTVTVNGFGTVHLTGYEDALATYSLSATRTGTGITTTFSSSVTTAATDVPEPVSLAILGTGLVAMGVARRKFVNQA